MAFVASVVATPAAGRLARRLGMLDRPGPFKAQREPVPYLGGLAVFVGLTVGTAAARPAFVLPFALALALGMADDRLDLAPGVRLACEVVIGVGAALVVPTGLPAPLGQLAVTSAVVVLVNAVNLIDGLDGLASGVALAGSVGFAVVLHGDDRLVASALAGASAGFLVHNRPPASIYLGDAGAYLLGTALALLLASAWAAGSASSAGVAAVMLVGVPLTETVVAVVRRWRNRRPLFQGDRGHVYDQLVDRGWTAGRASGACVVAQCVLSAIAVVAAHLVPGATVVVVATTGAAIVVIVGVGGFVAAGPRGGVT
ncbi:MAG: glycosyltransferase family 4 protein [Acidimicrobiales bacterium]